MILWLAIWLQLADPGETAIDAAAMLMRLRMLDGTPPVQDLGKLPPQWCCERFADFGREHSCWLESRWIMEPHLYGEWKVEHDRHWTFWALAYSAHADVGIVTRRINLARMRSIVGRQAWDGCDWPPPAPLWRFEVQ